MSKKKLLLTGGTGFVGSHIIDDLSHKYLVTLLGRSNDNNIKADLAMGVPVLPERYDVIFHAAGKAHTVPHSPEEEKEFFDVNLKGTENLCAALERVGIPHSFIYLSTVAVYGCESGDEIDESHPMDGSSPYALSKIAAEHFLIDWCHRHSVTLGIIRAPLIAGTNPPGNLRAMIQGIKSGRYFRIDRGCTRKSMLMVQDLVPLILALENRGGIYNVCDDIHPTVADIEAIIAGQLGRSRIISIPYWVAKKMARIGDKMGHRAPFNSNRMNKLTSSLTFSNARAKHDLNWHPSSVIDNFRIN